MPDWAVPQHSILIAVYALIVFEIVHRALAAASEELQLCNSSHVGNGPDLGP